MFLSQSNSYSAYSIIRIVCVCLMGVTPYHTIRVKWNENYEELMYIHTDSDWECCLYLTSLDYTTYNLPPSWHKESNRTRELNLVALAGNFSALTAFPPRSSPLRERPFNPRNSSLTPFNRQNSHFLLVLLHTILIDKVLSFLTFVFKLR